MASKDERKKTGGFSVHDTWGIFGKTVAEAKKILSKHKLTLRVVREDGNSYIVTADIRKNRVNVHVDNKKISFIRGIG